MSLQDRIKQAQNEAAVAEVQRNLGDEMKRWNELESFFTRTHSFEAVLARDGDNLVLMLPVSSKRLEDSMAQRLYDTIGKSLRGYDPKKTEIEGILGYELTRKKRGRFPSIFKVEVEGLHIDVNVAQTKLGLGQNSQHRIRGSSGRRVVRPSTKPYMPDVKIGFEFSARFDEKTTPKGGTYTLIAPRESREYFPGLGIPFTIQYDGGEIETHVTSAPRHVSKGALAGNYIATGTGKLGRDLGLRHHDMIRFKVRKPGKVYGVSKQN